MGTFLPLEIDGSDIEINMHFMISLWLLFPILLKTQGQEKEIWASCPNQSGEKEEENKGTRCCQQTATG